MKELATRSDYNTKCEPAQTTAPLQAIITSINDELVEVEGLAQVIGELLFGCEATEVMPELLSESVHGRLDWYNQRLGVLRRKLASQLSSIRA